MVKVFFNNSCNICRAEINHYKKHSDNSVEWVDVTNNKEAQKVTSKSYKELLRRMHVIQDGRVIDGAESFLIIWKNVPKYNFLYKIFKIKPLFFILNIFYELSVDCIILSTTGCHTNLIHIVYCYFFILVTKNRKNSHPKNNYVNYYQPAPH